ncbi:alpha-glucan family phosphorylase [Rhodocytophaga aerolata]|uniref:Alpha-glucan family phosphorylase n=1 Tax=Rhodocytophaga aerolata TaxID=455078 RepID=A0ABT8R9Z4_9BACT|nr:alpha-glucan family phosphorylase [Rhodocytophaga aerolata]MDO1448923.1 alpha-glucan family phosphorylase [Rhodocytophaga aerolata]
MSQPHTLRHPYEYNPSYKKRVAYFSMEFAIHPALKIYSGGLGFLAGSHMRSAYDTKQNLFGIGILWKYGYYDQTRNSDNTMNVLFAEKFYNFLEDPGIIVPVYVNKHQIYVKAYYLRPEVFGTVPMYLLTTDIAENDHLAQTITHKLYDNNTYTRIAQSIVLGIGGAKVVDALGGADIYHMNEGHALPLAFHLYTQFNRDVEEVKNRVRFTTHTPEKAGNEEHPIQMLDNMGFFSSIPLEEVRKITMVEEEMFSHTLVGLRLSRRANGVSQLHGEVSRDMWADQQGVCPIIAITNAQNKKYWADGILDKSLAEGDDARLFDRKMHLKKRLLNYVGDQTGKIFDPEVLTIVWARRFAEYKRPDLIKRDIMRFNRLISNKDRPVQIIWAGKPYPLDANAVSVFNHLVTSNRKVKNCAVLVGYELALSALLKKGADIWLNTPRRPREASGTSGMTAAMNGAINFSISDGWVIEFARHGENAFVIPTTDPTQPIDQQDNEDFYSMMYILENEILPTYYNKPDRWKQLVKNSMLDVYPMFDSDRMVDEYYSKLYI